MYRLGHPESIYFIQNFDIFRRKVYQKYAWSLKTKTLFSTTSAYTFVHLFFRNEDLIFIDDFPRMSKPHD